MRYGRMQNGRARENSLGNGFAPHFLTTPPSRPEPPTKLDGRNYFTGHFAYGTRVPRSLRTHTISPRTKDTPVHNLGSERFLSADLSYTWVYSRFRGSVTGFYTHIWNGMKRTGFYDYDLKAMMNYALSGVETRYTGC